MEPINDLQIEVTQIVIKRNSLLNMRRVFKFKTRVFIANIDRPSEEVYLAENNYITCGCLIMKDGEVIKTVESYKELSELHSQWFKESIEQAEIQEPDG